MKTTLQTKAALFLTAIMILPGISFAQEVTEEWVEDYDLGIVRIDVAYAIAVDDDGYTYVTGESNSANTNIDYYTIKYTPNGMVEESHRYDRGINNDDRPTAIAVDDSGNVYVTGESVGSGTSWDFVTIKYDSNLDVLWTRSYDGGISNEERAPSMDIDDLGNVYVTGRSVGAGTSWDYATIKYNTAGDELWVSRYNSTINNEDKPTDIGVDSQGNVYVTGSSIGTAWDYLTVKYNSAGEQQWNERYNHANDQDFANALVIDNSDNVIVTGQSVGGGTSYDYATLKYAPNGGTLWERRYNGPPANNQDIANAIGVDDLDNIYVTGQSVGSVSNWDYATIKYEAVSGDEEWVSRYDGEILDQDIATALAVDESGDVYVTGRSVGLGTSWDYATIKYATADGDEEWLQRFNRTPPGNNEDLALAIAVDGSGNVYVTGQSVGAGTNWDFVTVKYSQPVVISVETIEDASLVSVYPNPNSGNCTIALDKSYPTIEVRVMNYLGKEVQRRNYFNETQIEIDLDVPSGIYFIEVITDTRSTLKIIKN